MSHPLEGGKEVSASKFVFGKKGDFIKGTFTGFKSVNGQNGPVNLYEVKAMYGEYHPTENTTDENGNKIVKVLDPVMCVEGEYYQVWGGKDVIDNGFKKVKPGTIVGIRFEDATPAKKAGNSPFKVFKFVEFGVDSAWMGENSDDLAYHAQGM